MRSTESAKGPQQLHVLVLPTLVCQHGEFCPCRIYSGLRKHIEHEHSERLDWIIANQLAVNGRLEGITLLFREAIAALARQTGVGAEVYAAVASGQFVPHLRP